MFSATLHSDEVKDVAAKICQKPIVVDLKVHHHPLLLRDTSVMSISFWYSRLHRDCTCSLH